MTTKRLSKRQLLKRFTALDIVPEVHFISALPPSPPASRSASPATNGGLKRKLENGLATEPVNKRARTHGLPDTPKSGSSSAGSPGQAPATGSADFVPTVVKPREPGDPEWWKGRMEHYRCWGKMYKRSMEMRSRRGTTANRRRDNDAREYLLCFIEAVECVLCYAYHFWLSEMQTSISTRDANGVAAELWRSLVGMLGVAQTSGKTSLRCLPSREADRISHMARVSACLAMLQRLDGFVHASIARDSAAAAGRVLDSFRPSSGRMSSSTSPPGQQPTPPAVPSPAPSASHYTQQHSPSQMSAALGARGTLSPSPASGVSQVEMKALKEALEDARLSASSLSLAQESLHLQPDTLARFFPHTYRRLSDGSGLRAPGPGGLRVEIALELEAAPGTEVEAEGRIELGTTELVWPTVPASGPGGGIGALCCVTRAMLWEMGHPVGYGAVSTMARE